jgi:hypothetical protein
MTDEEKKAAAMSDALNWLRSSEAGGDGLDDPDALAKMLHIINIYTADFKSIPSIDRTIASHYNLQVGDVQQWLLRTEFSSEQLWESTVETIIEEFTAVGIIDRKVTLKDLVHYVPKIDEEE